MNAKVAQIRQELVTDLVQAGLYQKEALAMVETWHDSWFEEGLRVIYILPRGEVDALVPLRVTPAPAATARVFVGRVEVLAPWMKPDVAKFGRFAEPFARQLGLKINFPAQPAASCVP